MIDIDNWMRELEEDVDTEARSNEEYQTKLFEEYVLRGSDHQEERKKLNERYLSGEKLMGEHGLRKELAAFDMSYFGRAYLPHYFIRKSPHFHEELDGIWSRGVMKGRNPLKEAKVISRLKGSRQVIAAPRGHAKSTNSPLRIRSMRSCTDTSITASLFQTLPNRQKVFWKILKQNWRKMGTSLRTLVL